MTATVPDRVLAGDRPTGRLHLGHLVGSLRTRIALQHQTDTILVVADVHVLTTRPSCDALAQLPANVHGLVLDYLASGIDPEWVTIYL
jgi:tryptophanyl-tRNA synthetase